MTSATYNTAVTNSFGLIKIVVYELQVIDQYLRYYSTWHLSNLVQITVTGIIMKPD